jgi:hypothetical protein
MTAIRRAVIVALLAAWTFPAVGRAATEATNAAPLPAAVTTTSATPAGARATATETAQLAAREKQAQNLQDFKGGDGVYIYAGSGVLLVAVIILLLLII